MCPPPFYTSNTQYKTTRKYSLLSGCKQGIVFHLLQQLLHQYTIISVEVHSISSDEALIMLAIVFILSEHLCVNNA